MGEYEKRYRDPFLRLTEVNQSMINSRSIILKEIRILPLSEQIRNLMDGEVRKFDRLVNKYLALADLI